MCEATDRPVVASGGVTTLDDIRALMELVPVGVEGAIAGTALYEGRFTLEDALALTKGAGARMTLAVRVIPCLDVDGGRVVKGINFQELRDAGDPVELARIYDAEGADELTFLDISASHEGRATTMEVVSRCAEEVFIPLTVGGGVSSVEDVDRLLRAGADKVAINTAAIHRPELVAEIADRFGNQVLVLSVDARRVSAESGTASGFEVTTHGGRKSAGLDAIEWAVRAAELGAGEILLNAMDADGTQDGFDLDLITRRTTRGHDPGHRLRRRRPRRALRARGRGRRRRRPRGHRLPLRHPADRRRQGRDSRSSERSTPCSPTRYAVSTLGRRRGSDAAVARESGDRVRRAVEGDVTQLGAAEDPHHQLDDRTGHDDRVGALAEGRARPGAVAAGEPDGDRQRCGRGSRPTG